MRSRCLVLILTISLLYGCLGIRPHDQAASIQECPTVKIELFFGLSFPDGGSLSESEWKNFTASSITPRFPGGFTVYDASGQWLNAFGALTKEGTKVVVLITDNSREKFLLIDEIREAFKEEFRQESVLLVNSCVNASF